MQAALVVAAVVVVVVAAHRPVTLWSLILIDTTVCGQDMEKDLWWLLRMSHQPARGPSWKKIRPVISLLQLYMSRGG